MKGRAQSLVGGILTQVRRGSRTVLWTQRNINLGNFLYHWMVAYTRQCEGEDVRVLRTPEMEPWLPVFPGVVDRLLINSEDVRFLDRRNVHMHQGWGLNYWPEHVERFAAYLLATTTLPIARRDDADSRVVVNVRRGDYFSTYADRYSFDVSTYLRVAVGRQLLLGGPAQSIHVVSDDIGWCQERLGWLEEYAGELTFASAGPTPHEDFVALVTARRLVLTHTSFGYWGAHLSNALYGDNEELVVAPWFHNRTIWSGASYMLNPAWTVIRHIPGGWGPEPTD